MEKGKKLGLLNLMGLCIGSAIGTGIFIMMGSGIAYTGRSIVLVCGFGCVYMLLAFWYSLAFGSVFVLPGGDYDIRSVVFPPVLSGISAWFQIANGFVLAGHSLAIAQFAAMLWPQITEYESLFALAVMTVGFLCTIRGSKVLTVIQNIITGTLIIALILFLVYGIPQVSPASYFSNADGEFFHGGFAGFLTALSVMSFACMGTSAMTSMAPVTRNPKRTIPLGSLLATLVVAVIYALIGYVAAGILPYDQIANQNISVTARAIMPSGAYVFFVVGGGIFAVASTMLSVIASLRYPVQRVAEDGWIPSFFLKSTKGGYPWVMYIVLYLVSTIPLLTGLDIEGIVGNVMIPCMFFNAFINFYCLTIPKRYPQQWAKRGIQFPVWLWNIFSICGGVFAILVIYNLFISLDPKAAALCVGEVIVTCVLAVVSLKKKWVTPELLTQRKQSIIEKAIADEAAENA